MAGVSALIVVVNCVVAEVIRRPAAASARAAVSAVVVGALLVPALGRRRAAEIGGAPPRGHLAVGLVGVDVDPDRKWDPGQAERLWRRYARATREVAVGAPALVVWPELVGPVDVVYEASGASHVAFELMTALGPNGVFIFTGVPGRKEKIELDTSALMRSLVLRNQVVLGTVNAGQDAFEAAIRDLGRFALLWPDAVRTLITARHDPEEYATLLQGQASGIKHVVGFARE